MMPTENKQEFRSVVAWKASFCALFACRLTKWPKWPDQGTNGRTRDLQTERSFSMMKHFRHSSEAVGLSQDSKMLQQLTGQISAHYCSSKVKKILIYVLFVRTKEHAHTSYFIPVWFIVINKRIKRIQLSTYSKENLEKSLVLFHQKLLNQIQMSKWNERSTLKQCEGHWKK